MTTDPRRFAYPDAPHTMGVDTGTGADELVVQEVPVPSAQDLEAAQDEQDQRVIDFMFTVWQFVPEQYCSNIWPWKGILLSADEDEEDAVEEGGASAESGDDDAFDKLLAAIAVIETHLEKPGVRARARQIIGEPWAEEDTGDYILVIHEEEYLALAAFAAELQAAYK